MKFMVSTLSYPCKVCLDENEIMQLRAKQLQEVTELKIVQEQKINDIKKRKNAKAHTLLQHREIKVMCNTTHVCSQPTPHSTGSRSRIQTDKRYQEESQ
jgi:hypothetical protein